MGLSSALSAAITGLNVNQAGLELVSRNVANAGTPGYTRKSLVQENVVAGADGFGVRQVTVTRDVNQFLQTQLQTELSISGMQGVTANFLDRLDMIYGQPGSEAALDTMINRFSESLQELASSPETDIVRDAAVHRADLLAGELNQLSADIQMLRRDAESGIAAAVADTNEILEQIASLNTSIMANHGTLGGSADLEDQRDALVNRLAEMIDISTSHGEYGTLRVFTSNGDLLVDGTASKLNFDERGNIGAHSLYNNESALRGVGTVTVEAANGSEIDLIRGRPQFSGVIGGYIQLRDDILVEAQAQLDELAHGLALSFSDYSNDGSAITSGAQDGFELDIEGLLAGNAVTISYTESGTDKSVTFIRVDDASTLPLSDDATPNPDDTVVGIDFSGGIAAAAADMSAALGAAISVSSPAAGSLRFLDDGAAATVDIAAVSARITSTGLADNGAQLALFRDSGGAAYSASLDGADQKLGFAGRIMLNGSVAADNSWLVSYSTSPATGNTDPTRPLELISRLNEQSFTFSPESGIGSSNAPYTDSVADFARRVVASQTGRAEVARQTMDSQEIVVGALQQRIHKESGVNIDEEMALLLELQNAYASSARVVTAIKEMTELLLNI